MKMAFDFRKIFKRTDAVDDCRVAAWLHLPDDIALPGMIMKIGSGVVLFREASQFVLVRDGMAVKIVFEGGEVEGVIERSSPQGYLVKATAERMAA
jgi:hypothetical protein